jgi:uncharacterized protein YgiM (DUF1202 family)
MLAAVAAVGWVVALLNWDNPGATQAMLATPGAEQVARPDNPDATHATLAMPGAEHVAAQFATSTADRMHATNPETASPLGEAGASLLSEADAEQAAQLSASRAERALDALIEQASPGDTASQATSTPADEGAQSPTSATVKEGTEISHQVSAFEPAAATAPGQHEPTSLEAGRWDGAGLGDAWGAEYYVSTAPVNLRTAPASEAASLAVVPEGDLVKMIGRKRNWLNVEYSHAGVESVTGWVYSDYLRRAPRPEKDGP